MNSTSIAPGTTATATDNSGNGGAAVTGFGGAATTGASNGHTKSSAALAIDLGSSYGLGVVLSGIFAGFALLL